MPSKYFLLALVMLFNQDIVCSHILTSRDLPLTTCMKMLSLAARELCGIYGETSSEEAFNSMDRGYNINPFVIQRCCTHPCTIPELMLAC